MTQFWLAGASLPLIGILTFVWNTRLNASTPLVAIASFHSVEIVTPGNRVSDFERRYSMNFLHRSV